MDDKFHPDDYCIRLEESETVIEVKSMVSSDLIYDVTCIPCSVQIMKLSVYNKTSNFNRSTNL